MTYQLTPEQSALYEEGNWMAWHIEEDILDMAIRDHITEQIVVLLDTGAVAFAVTMG